MSQDQIIGARLVLAMRSSRLSEYRSPEGALLVFEIGSQCTNFGLLCTKLGQMPGVEFPDNAQPARYAGPARFRYKNTDYEISIPHQDYRIGPIDLSVAPEFIEELMEYVKEKVAPAPRPQSRDLF